MESTGNKIFDAVQTILLATEQELADCKVLQASRGFEFFSRLTGAPGFVVIGRDGAEAAVAAALPGFKMPARRKTA